VVRAGSARVDLELDIDWHERERLLSIAFPHSFHTEAARCDIQFGHVSRPTHANTSWDAAKFEVCAHRWVDVAEADAGLAVLNAGRYGHSVLDGVVRVSLQRGSRFPDPMADEGRHEVTLALLPHGPGLHDVVAEAERLNVPLRVIAGGAASALPEPIITIADPAVLVSAVKRADDGDDLVLRVWESVGGRAQVDLPPGARRTNLLEEPADDAAEMSVVPAGRLRPFELATWRWSERSANPAST
jgi:alpha-mannosidase